jgi:hypothetical protein
VGGRHSKEKGNKWERAVSRYLTLWITGTETPLLFWRSSGSGAFWTVSKSSDGQAGDVAAIHPDGSWLINRFTLECKSVKPIQFDPGHTNVKKGLEEYWAQTVRQAREINREPLMFLKRNNRKEVMGCSLRIGAVLQKLIPESVTYTLGGRLEPVVLFVLADVLALQFETVRSALVAMEDDHENKKCDSDHGSNSHQKLPESPTGNV